jgi:hypothetical protein
MSAQMPFLDLFKRGEVPQEVRMLAAQGALAPRALEQLQLLVLLVDDENPAIAGEAAATIARIPPQILSGFLARPEVPESVRKFFAERGLLPGEVASLSDEPLIQTVDGESEESASDSDAPGPDGTRVPLSMLPVTRKVKLAMRGTREHRSLLIRDPNKLVATSVLASPKLTDSEVEGFARMANVSGEVLRLIGTSRAWAKNYTVMSALAKNPKTPLSVSLPFIPHLNLREVKMMSTDRNLPEQVRLSCRKIMSKYRL